MDPHPTDSSRSGACYIASAITRAPHLYQDHPREWLLILSQHYRGDLGDCIVIGIPYLDPLVILTIEWTRGLVLNGLLTPLRSAAVVRDQPD